MSPPTSSALRFGDYSLDEGAFRLFLRREPVEVEPRALKLLFHLLRNRQRAVSRNELAAIIWPDSVVGESSLKEAVNLARRAVGDSAEQQRVIATLRGHGYRFVASVDEPQATSSTPGGGNEKQPLLLGRADELERLGALAAAVVRGGSRIILLDGEAGIGKTTLARHFADHCGDAGFAIVRGRGDSDCAAPSFWLWIQVLRDLLQRPEINGLRRQNARSLAHAEQLARGEALTESGIIEAQGRRLWLFDDVARVLRLVSATTPLLILLEDLHAASENSLLMLRFLARHLEPGRVLILATCRPSEAIVAEALRTTIVELRRLPWFGEIRLEGLAIGDIEQMVGARATPSLIPELHRRTRGNPLFLKEILHHCAGRVGSDWISRSNAVSTLSGCGVPGSVRDLVAQRMTPLAPTTRDFLDAAAVLGERFQAADVAHLVGRPLAVMRADIDELQQHGLLQAERGPAIVGERCFAHPVVREAVFGLLPPARARELHDRAARRLESVGRNQHEQYLPQLAYHSLAAVPEGSIARAVRYARAAALQATSRFAYEDAAALYRDALRAAELRSRRSLSERAQLLIALGGVASRTSAHATARQAADEAFAIGERLRDDEVCAAAATCAVGPTLLRLQTGTSDDRQIEMIDVALRRLPVAAKSRRVHLYSQLAMALYWSSDTQRCLAAAEEAVALARRLDEPSTLALALHARCMARWRPSIGRPDIDTVREAIAVADRAGEPDLAMSCGVRLAHVLAELGEISELDRVTDELARRAEDLNYPQARLWPKMLGSSRLVRERKLEEAAATIAAVPDAARDAWEAEAAPYYAMLLGLLRREQGSVDDLAETLEHLSRVVPKFLIEAPLPLILGGLGQFERAAEVYARLVSQRPWQMSDHLGTIASLSFIADAAARFGDRNTASEIYAVLAPHAGEFAVLSGVAGVLAPVRYSLGQLCGVLGRYDEALAQLERCADECRRAGQRSDLARTHLACARVLKARNQPGDDSAAAALGEKALSQAQELTIPLLVADATMFNLGWDLPPLGPAAP